MSTDKASIRRDTNLHVVVSEYFSHNPVMDESSSKDKKTKPSTSKNSQAKPEKVQKKPRKRIKGQKDIRTLIKPKKNELVTYSKEFDSICKQLGVDVDPEQLQLAIALSKSLQDSEDVFGIAHKEKALTANQRRGRIRTTLQEYGFKVPDITKKPKKIKKYKKQYQLLLVSDAEKQARIADKYSQTLFRNISYSLSEDLDDFEKPNSFLYHIATNISYKYIKNDDIFYVNNLVEKSLAEKHHMLKDWSEIPGRPKSPVQEVAEICFKSVQCTEKELAGILSGTIKTAKYIIKKKFEDLSVNEVSTKDNENYVKSLDTQAPILKFGGSDQISSDTAIKENVTINENSIQSIKSSTDNLYKETLKMPLPTYRSCSPDIFDDEVTIIMDNSTDVITVQECLSEKTMVREEQNDFMDLTECVHVVNCNVTNPNQYSCLSQGSNNTKMNPNDFMELTGCVTTCSQRNINEIQINCNLMHKNYSQTITMDQTKTISTNSLPEGNNEYGNKSADDTVIVVDEEYCNPIHIKETDIIDLVEDLNTTGNSNTVSTVNCPNKSSHVNVNHIDIIDDLSSGSLINAIPKGYPNLKENYRNVQQNDFHEVNDLDAMDLTQSSDSNNSLPFKQIQDGDSNSVETIPINDAEQNTAEDDPKYQLDSSNYADHPVDTADNYNLLNAVQSPTENKYPVNEEYYEPHNSLCNFQLSMTRNADQNQKKHDNLPQNHDEHEAINLTQSSNSENSLHLSQNTREFRNLHRVELNDNDYRYDLPNNDIIKNDEINTTYSGNVSPKYTENEQRTLDNLVLDGHLSTNNKYNSVMKFDNDQEFDDIVKNVSKSKLSTAYNSNLDREVELLSNNNSVAYDNHSIFENDPNIQTNEFNSTRGFAQNAHDESIYRAESYEENCEIDLTQKSDSSEDKVICSSEIIKVPVQLGKRNNMSIDYDEEYNHEESMKSADVINIGASNVQSFVQMEKNRSKDDAISGSSQNSEVFEISDDEFNYSIKECNSIRFNSVRLDRTKFNIGGVSAIDEFLNRNSLSCTKLRCSCSTNSGSNNENDNCQPEVIFTENKTLPDNVRRKSKSFTEIETVKTVTPLKTRSIENVMFAQTPKHNDYIIKTDVTPMPNYEIMTSPERNEELDRFGIKPLKRKRAIHILTHIYNQTHPIMEVVSETENLSSPCKIRRQNDHMSFPKRAIVNEIDLVTSNSYVTPITSLQMGPSSQNPSQSCNEISQEKRITNNKSPINKDNVLYEETKQLPDIKNIECSFEDWVFQKREKAKVHSCRVPLHIAFHNYVSCRRALREAILRYEPINIDDIHKGLVAVGYRYNPKDLLKFMDKKCITVKTADNARNSKK